MRAPDSEVEHFAKVIAMFHGGKMIYRNRDGMQTVASSHGYGHYGDASSRYMHAHWEEYVQAAEVVMKEIRDKRRKSKGFRRHIRMMKRRA